MNVTYEKKRGEAKGVSRMEWSDWGGIVMQNRVKLQLLLVLKIIDMALKYTYSSSES